MSGIYIVLKHFWGFLLFILQKSNANNKKNKRTKKFLREHQEKVRRAVEELKREREEVERLIVYKNTKKKTF